VSPEVVKHAVEITRAIGDALDLIGVFRVDYFVTGGGHVLVSGIAPRPHASGLWTLDGCVTSQFEQQLRAVCGLPLGAVTQLAPAAMANLLGDLWNGGEPDWNAATSVPDVKLHLYGKSSARPGSKMGHLTALAATTEQALADVEKARALLSR